MSHLMPWSPTRRTLNGLVLALPWWWRAQEREVQRSASGEPHFVAPPGEPTEALRARVAELEKLLLAGKTKTNEILLDPAAAELRPYPLFRELIARHAREPRAQLTPKGEPGTPLVSALTIVDAQGQPYRDVRVYAYQTCAKGWYAAEAPHVSGNSGDTKFARLFAYARTDAEGRCELVGVRPAPYPRSDLPSHIHLHLEGRDGDLRVTELRFEDCPKMTPAERAASEKNGYLVVPVTKAADGSAHCAAEFRLPRA